MKYIIQPTKTNAGRRIIPITDEIAEMFKSTIENRTAPKIERVIDGYSGFLFFDKNNYPAVALHWEHRFKHMVNRYNEIYRIQMPSITPHVCRHTYCSNQAKAGMNPKTLQYLMGCGCPVDTSAEGRSTDRADRRDHSDISVTLNVYTHVNLEDAEKELQKMQQLEDARREMGLSDKDDKPIKQTMFKAM